MRAVAAILLLLLSAAPLAAGLAARHLCVAPALSPSRAAACSSPCSRRGVVRRTRDVRMEEAPFWENVGRFMRFGVSAISGLIIGLLAPFASVFGRSPAAAAVGASLALGVVVFFYVTLQAMEAPPADLMAADVEPSMQSMLNDLYGSGT